MTMKTLKLTTAVLLLLPVLFAHDIDEIAVNAERTNKVIGYYDVTENTPKMCKTYRRCKRI